MRKYIFKPVVKIIGVLLIIIGLIGFFLPVLPFFIPTILGLSFLGIKPEFIEKIKRSIGRVWRKIRKKENMEDEVEEDGF